MVRTIIIIGSDKNYQRTQCIKDVKIHVDS